MANATNTTVKQITKCYKRLMKIRKEKEDEDDDEDVMIEGGFRDGPGSKTFERPRFA